MLINKMNKNIFKNILNIDHGHLKISFPDDTKISFGDSKSNLSGKLILKIGVQLNKYLIMVL